MEKKLNIRGHYLLVHITQPNLLHYYSADLSEFGQRTPEGILYRALNGSFGS